MLIIGFPPKPIFNNNQANLSQVGLQNGEVIIVENSPEPLKTTDVSLKLLL